MKNKKHISAFLYFVASTCFNVAAIIGFIFSDNTTMSISWLCLGASMLCLGGCQLNKSKKDDKDNKDQKDE